MYGYPQGPPQTYYQGNPSYSPVPGMPVGMPGTMLPPTAGVMPGSPGSFGALPPTMPYGGSPMAGTALPGTMPVPPGSMAMGMAATSMLSPPPGTMVIPQAQSMNYYDPRYMEDAHLRSYWDSPSFKSTYSGSSQEEKKPLKGSGQNAQGKKASIRPSMRRPATSQGLVIQNGTYIFAAVVAIGALLLFYMSLYPMQSDQFLTFSQLGYQCWYPSLFAFVCVLCFLGVCAFVLALVTCIGANQFQKTLLQAAIYASIVLGLILIIIAGVFYYNAQQAKPDVLRVTNLICQDESVWCEDLPTTTIFRSTTSGSRASGAEATARQERRRRLEVGSVEGGIGEASSPRRLDTDFAQAAIDYDKKLHDLAPNMPCEQVQAMCRRPPHFDPFRACMCSGQWDYSGHLPTSTTPAIPATTTSQNTTGPSNVTDGAAGLLRRRLTVEASQLPPEAPGPWYGSIGAYCAKWDAQPGFSSKEWCFVYDTAKCPSTLVTPRDTSDGRSYFSSTGPCGGDVDSRSEYILDGLDLTLMPALIASILGLLLLFLACLAREMRKVEPAKKDAKTAQKEEEKHHMTIEAQFERAQREAVHRLRDQTPENQKLQLYGLYKQAKEGPNMGVRPQGFMKQKEQAKWDAWYAVRDKSSAEAIGEYIDVVASLD